MQRRFTLSANPDFGDADDISLGDQAHGEVVAQTTTGSLTSVQTLPSGLAPGAYYVFLTLDPTGLVPESNEANNTKRSATTFTVDPPVAATFGFEDTEAEWSMTGFWSRSALAGAGIVNATFGPLPAPFTGSRALWYGRPQTGNFVSTIGGATSGNAISSSFTMPTGSQVKLEFKTWWEIEGVQPYAFDIMSVELEVTTATGTEIRVLKRLNPTSTSIGSSSQVYSSAGFNVPPIWVTESILIPADIQGKTVRIRFGFNTLDGLYNNMRGWIVDDVAVRVGSTGSGSLSPSSLKPLLSSSSGEGLVPADQIVPPPRPPQDP
jgi:hypothetical protein